MNSKTGTLFLISSLSIGVFGCAKNASQDVFSSSASRLKSCDAGLDGGGDGGCDNAAPVVVAVPACEAEEKDSTTITLYCRPNLKYCGKDKPGRWKDNKPSTKVAEEYLIPLLEKTSAIVKRGPFTSYVFPGARGEIEYRTERSPDPDATRELYIIFNPRVVTKASPNAIVQPDACTMEAMDIITNPKQGPFELISEKVDKVLQELAETNNDNDGNLYRRMKCTFYPRALESVSDY